MDSRITTALAAPALAVALAGIAVAEDRPTARSPQPPAASRTAPLPPADDPVAAVTAGRLSFNLRARAEHVEQDGKQEDALALTNRTLLGWQSAPWKGFSGFVQVIDVANFNDSFNEGPAASPRYPTVADPDNTDLNQVYADWAGLPGTKLRLGKQSLKLDNVRFVGNVEFRQVMQVLSGLWIENRPVDGLELDAGHFDRIKNVFAQQRQTDISMLRAAWTWRPDNVLVGFAYFQDQPVTGQATGFADNSNRIAGVRANGSCPTGALKLLYTAEFARQQAHAGGDPRIDATYSRLGAGLGGAWGFVRLDHDRLGSNQGLYGFQTPLGTNHLFQGWADLFLTTPAQGIRDTYLTAGTTFNGVQIYTEVHDFRSDFGGIRYGSELDVGVTWPLSRGFTGKVEAAVFDEADRLPGAARKSDTTRLWLTLMYNY